MATTVACRECGNSFTISPEHLGRKYRCKSCGTVNVAEESKPPGDRKRKSSTDAARRKPTRKTSQQRAAGGSQRPRNSQKKRRPKPAPEPTYDEYSYDYDEAEYESYDTYGEYDAVEEYQPSRSRSRQSSGKKQSSGRKKKRGSSSKSSGESTPWKKIGSILGTVLLVLFIAGRVLRVVGRIDRAIGNGPAAAASGSVTESQVLTEYASSNGGFRVKMPSPVSEKHSRNVASNELSWNWEAFGDQCIFRVDKQPALLELEGEAGRVRNSFEPSVFGNVPGVQSKGELTNERPVTMGGHEAVEFEFAITEPERSSWCVRVAVVDSQLWKMSITASGPVSSETKDQFFNSFQLTAEKTDTSVSVSGTESSPTLTGAASPDLGNQQAAVQSFDSQRLQFKTRLLRQGPAPQPYENVTPPAGVEQVKYQSEGRDLMAWLARPANAQGNVPAVVYFHGGFAFGASDFEDALPFLESGYAVMIPTLRGENGNPGYFEMLGGEYIDACNAVRWLSRQPGIDSEQIHAFGHSVGGGLSALLSLAEDIPLKTSGGSGGLYPPQVFRSWALECPFALSDKNEIRMRLLFGNEQSMQRPHLAYLGAGDEIRALSAPFIDRAKSSAPKLKVVTVSGDHFSSLQPAILAYINEIRTDVQ